MKQYLERRQTLIERKAKYSTMLQTGDYGAMRLAQLKGNITRTVNELSQIRPYAAKILLCLKKQREQNTPDTVTKFPHISDHKRQHAMQLQPPSLLMMMQRAFSLPEDYFIEKKNPTYNDRTSIIDHVVVHPEMISWELLDGLGYLPFDIWEKLTDEEKLEKQITSIPFIKRDFKHFITLPIGTGRYTSRVIRVCNTNNPIDGRYIVFRENSSMYDDRNHTSHGKRKNSTSVSVYYDMYSFIRGQEHATKNLESRAKELGEALEKIQELRIQWNTLPESTQREKIQELREILSKRLSYHAKYGLKTRLEKIEFKNKSHDSMRLLWLYNDLIKWEKEKIGKLAHVRTQSEGMRESLHHAAEWYSEMCKFFFKTVQIIDKAWIELFFSMHTNEEKVKFPPWVSNVIGSIWHGIRSWIELSGSNMFLGHPYSDLHDVIAKILKWVPGMNAQENFAALQKIGVILKKGLFRSVIYTIYDSIKSGRFSSERKKLQEKLSFVRWFLNETQFGKVLEPLETLGYLDTIEWHITKNSPEEIIYFLEKHIPFISMR